MSLWFTDEIFSVAFSYSEMIVCSFALHWISYGSHENGQILSLTVKKRLKYIVYDSLRKKIIRPLYSSSLYNVQRTELCSRENEHHIWNTARVFRHLRTSNWQTLAICGLQGRAFATDKLIHSDAWILLLMQQAGLSLMQVWTLCTNFNAVYLTRIFEIPLPLHPCWYLCQISAIWRGWF